MEKVSKQNKILLNVTITVQVLLLELSQSKGQTVYLLVNIQVFFTFPLIFNATLLILILSLLKQGQTFVRRMHKV